jgi:hypothetical protein
LNPSKGYVPSAQPCFGEFDLRLMGGHFGLGMRQSRLL